ncbi:MAG: hypothetical protein ABI794_07820 [Betaproteobacteria bacterium]
MLMRLGLPFCIVPVTALYPSSMGENELATGAGLHDFLHKPSGRRRGLSPRPTRAIDITQAGH